MNEMQPTGEVSHCFANTEVVYGRAVAPGGTLTPVEGAIVPAHNACPPAAGQAVTIVSQCPTPRLEQAQVGKLLACCVTHRVFLMVIAFHSYGN